MKFDKKQFAILYHRQQEESGYPGKLLPFILDQLHGYTSVIDIGSGTGFFSIPLADSGHIVTAVEPSEQMSHIMKTRYSSESPGRIILDNTIWENWNGTFHDASICIHSFYPLTDRKLSVKKMISFSRRRIIIIRNARQMKTMTGLVREELGLAGTPDHNDELLSIIKSLDVPCSITEIRDDRNIAISNIKEEAEFIVYRSGIEPGLSDNIIDILKKNSTYSGGQYIFHSCFCDNAYVF